MRTGAVLLALVALGSAASGAEPAMTRETAALIEPVHDAYDVEALRQAHLPPATSDRERLERLYEIDQAGREAMQMIDLSQLSEEQQDLAIKDVARAIVRHDIANPKALKKMLPKSGWFRRSEIGEKAEKAAFLIIQHAVNDPALMHALLPRIEAAVKLGDADGGDYAVMYDRIALEFDHKPQRYGSQLRCVEGHWAPYELEDPDHLDDLRAAVGLPSEAETLQRSEEASPCS